MRKASAPVLMAAAIVLCVATAGAETSQAVVTRTSRPVRLLRSWEETVKASGGREYARKVEVVFDYGQGIARENYYTLDGRLYGSRAIKQNLPAPSPEEIAEAIALVQQHAGFVPIFARFRVVPEGGFLLQEDRGRPCGPGSRCLQIFLLSSDRAGLIRRVVVDLVTKGIPYRSYVPAEGRAR
ncbi:MAG: hypothetical protein WAU32_13860 [Thermoanaerobaculia bacterium]